MNSTMQSSVHTFHIPVMGLGYTIDTPIKVAKYGINSVVSIIEDHLIEQMREIISRNHDIPYEKISTKDHDSRARRITVYLNLLNVIVQKQIHKIKTEDFQKDLDINTYFDLLPEDTSVKKLYIEFKSSQNNDKINIEKKLREYITAGTIDVNIMTKLDKINHTKSGEELPFEFSDALSALRGYANSDLSSSIVFSAGLNPRLFAYCTNFKDFYPDESGDIKKKIILKVSDYRSALIQGKYLAKKGLWVSEFRIESGINCGGHAFISNGMLMGPILEEFKNKKEELFNELHKECLNALILSKKQIFTTNPTIKITAQGGIGTFEEHQFIIKNYGIDSIGWGSPFLMVPEATNVDKETLSKLSRAKPTDYFVSNASPLGVPFNNFKESSSEKQRKQRVAKNKPGSPCYKKFLSNNTEFTETAICTASRQYQHLKINQIRNNGLSEEINKIEIDFITEKDCLCAGLGASTLLVNHEKPTNNLSAVTICPGPNLAYFSGIFTLRQMINHIYGRTHLLNKIKRPHVFVNELKLYFSYIKSDFEKTKENLNNKRLNYFKQFLDNILVGIDYYENFFNQFSSANEINNNILGSVKSSVEKMQQEIHKLSLSTSE